MSQQRAALRGLGTALPAVPVPQSRAAEFVAEMLPPGDRRARTAAALFRRSGIDSRRSVLVYERDGRIEQEFYPLGQPAGPGTAARMAAYAELAPPLALEAAARALESADVPTASVTHLVTVSCTGFAAPGVDLALIRGLDLAPTVERTHVGFMGCQGALNGLRSARALTESSGAVVLMVCVELSSLHLQPTGGDGQLIANSLFADGAAAAVIAPPAADTDWIVSGTASRLLPDSADQMGWRVGDHGFDIVLDSAVPDHIEARLAGWLLPWLERRGLGVDDLALAVHPGGARILDAVEAALDLAPERLAASRGVLREFGNMSSPTVLFVLDRLRSASADPPALALAFGPGLFAELVLFERLR